MFTGHYSQTKLPLLSTVLLSGFQIPWGFEIQWVMPQSHPTMGPIRFLAPIWFLAHKSEWSACRNFTPVLFFWSHQATSPLWLDTAVHFWFDRIICRTPHGPLWCPYGCHMGPTQDSTMFLDGTLMNTEGNWPGFYTKGRPLVKSNLICPSDKLNWQPGCTALNINIQGNFCISQGTGSSDNLPENLV